MGTIYLAQPSPLNITAHKEEFDEMRKEIGSKTSVCVCVCVCCGGGGVHYVSLLSMIIIMDLKLRLIVTLHHSWRNHNLIHICMGYPVTHPTHIRAVWSVFAVCMRKHWTLGYPYVAKWRLIWAAAWQNQQNDLCDQQRLRSAWASAQSDQSLRCPHEETLDP